MKGVPTATTVEEEFGEVPQQPNNELSPAA